MATMQMVFRSTSRRREQAEGDSECRAHCGEVVVIYTDTEGTIEALRTSLKLAAGRAARIRLLVPQIVPYPLPIEQPPVPIDFIENRLSCILSELGVDTHIDVRLCRDISVVLMTALPPVSVVVVGGRRRWWPTSQSRLVKRLRRLGHQVVFSTFS